MAAPHWIGLPCQPLGPEHTDEIADTLLLGLKHNAKLSGVDAGSSVGSPLYDLGHVSERRLAQVMQSAHRATRGPVLCASSLPDGVGMGANVMVVDIGRYPGHRCVDRRME